MQWEETLTINNEEYKWRTNSYWASKKRPKITGNTVEEKTLSLLKRYGLGYTINTRKEASETYKVKYQVAICIAWADSSLGLDWTTKYNIGNVWNNDRWKRKEFDSIHKWIRAIFQTLTNRYVWLNKTIWELSQWWRDKLWLQPCKAKNNFCYATSKENWNINVLNCLNMLYNSPKDETFIYKIEQW